MPGGPSHSSDEESPCKVQAVSTVHGTSEVKGCVVSAAGILPALKGDTPGAADAEAAGCPLDPKS